MSTNVDSGIIPESHKVRTPHVHISEQANKMHCGHTVKNNAAEPQNVMLSGRSQTRTKGSFQHPKCPGRTPLKTEHRSGAGGGEGDGGARLRTARSKETLRGDGKV